MCIEISITILATITGELPVMIHHGTMTNTKKIIIFFVIINNTTADRLVI